MNEKIEWFQEVLSMEPGSKVFFPLARLFVEIGEPENAVVTLAKGLDRNPAHLEARMLLVHTLAELGRESEALEQLDSVVSPLADYPSFWKLWAKSVTRENKDLAVFLMIVASNLRGADIGWTDLVHDGLNTLSDRLVGGPPIVEKAEVEAVEKSAPVELLDEVEQPDFSDEELIPEPGIRTRTMADLLASQGDFRNALDIYTELWDRTSGSDRDELAGRIEEMESELKDQDEVSVETSDDVAPEGDPFSQHAKNRLIGTLEALAARFEARIKT